MNIDEKIKRVNILLSRWVNEVSSNKDIGYNDDCKSSEDISCHLLNLIYNYELTNLNKLKNNYKGIDLGDDKNEIAFQIKACNKKYYPDEIKDSLNKIEIKDIEKYKNGIYFLFIDDSKIKLSNRVTNSIIKIYKSKFPNIEDILEKNIISLEDLFNDISKTFDSDIKLFYKILSYLEDCIERIDYKITIEVPLIQNKKEIEPYKGLETFKEEDNQFFFGRDSESEILLEKHKAKRFLAIVGPAGYGKSSLVQAGLIPKIKKTSLVALFRPRNEPLTELASSIRKLSPNNSKPSTSALIKSLSNNQDDLHHLAKDLLSDNGKDEFVIVIDQFEEFFSPNEKRDEQNHFISIMLAAIQKKDSIIRIIITLRSDFIHKCKFNPELFKYVTEDSYKLEPMSPDYLKLAILEPAKNAGLDFENGLLDQILNDVKGTSSQLPMLGHAMLELYRRRENNLITMKAYNEIKGIKGALVEHAESEYNKLTDDSQKDILRDMFVLRMIQPGDGTYDTRRWATREELLAVGNNPEISEQIMNQWINARLLTIKGNDLPENEYIDVAHDALISEWDKIIEWKEIFRDNSRRMGVLRTASYEWTRSNHNPDFLFQGAKLEQIQEDLEYLEGNLTQKESEFIKCCNDMENMKTKKNRIRKRVSTALIIMLTITLAFAIILWRRADRLHEDSVINRLIAISILELPRDNIKAIRIAEAVYKKKMPEPPPNSVQALLLAAGSILENPFYSKDLRHANTILSVNISNYSNIIVTTSIDQTARLWNSDGQLLGSPLDHSGQITNAKFSPNGNYLLTISNDNKVKLWAIELDLKSEFEKVELRAELNDHQDIINNAFFSENSDFILTASSDCTAKLWDLKGNMLRNFPHTAPVRSAYFSKDGDKILTVSDDHIARLWDRYEENVPPIELKHEDDISSAQFSPSGDKIITASWDNTARLWDLKGNPIKDIIKNDAPISGASFSKEGEIILLWDRNEAKLLNLDGTRIATLTHSGQKITAAIFSSVERRIQTWSGNDLKIWDYSGTLISDWSNFNDSAYHTIISYDETIRVIWAGSTAKIANLNSKLITNLKISDRIQNAVISPDGSTSLIWNDNHLLLTPINGKNSIKIELKEIELAFFLADSQHFIVHFDNGSELYYNRDGKIWRDFNINQIKPYTKKTKSAESPDGKKKITWSGSVLKLWDSKGNLLADLNRHTDYILDATFYKDNENMTWIISISRDGTIKKWATPETIINWLKTAPIRHLTNEEKKQLGINEE